MTLRRKLGLVDLERLTLFVPDNIVDPTQFTRDGPCHIDEIRVIGDFQHLAQPPATDWDTVAGLLMDSTQHANGYLFTYRLDPPL